MSLLMCFLQILSYSFKAVSLLIAVPSSPNFSRVSQVGSATTSSSVSSETTTSSSVSSETTTFSFLALGVSAGTTTFLALGVSAGTTSEVVSVVAVVAVVAVVVVVAVSAAFFVFAGTTVFSSAGGGVSGYDAPCESRLASTSLRLIALAAAATSATVSILVIVIWFRFV